MTIEVDATELILINNSINEALELVEDWEFETRVGATREAAKRLLVDVGNILDRKSGQGGAPPSNK